LKAKAKPLSEEEIKTWHTFKQAGEFIFSLVVRDVAAATGLSAGDYGVLSRLVDLGGGTLRQIDLAKSMRWDKARLSHHLTRMQDRGLIAREHVSGKEVFVKITQQGQTVLADARPAHALSVRRYLLDRLSREETKVLSKILTRLSAQSPLASDGDGLRADGA
jgi:DNA-binding MarR family transcriptional regulator